SPRQSLRPLLAQRLSPILGTIRKCIQMLRPDLGEAEATFFGTSILGQVTGHGFLRGATQAVWGAADPLGSPFQASELLVDFCLHGLMGPMPSEV
ncbi:MAG TPA: hypothetical protein VN436_10995, partial [Holophaga sp.]|nr:hypothetical protein [Holophaga sp.]